MTINFAYKSIKRVARASWIIPLIIIPLVAIGVISSFGPLPGIHLFCFVLAVIGIILGVISIWSARYHKKQKSINYNALTGVLLNIGIIYFFQLPCIVYWAFMPSYADGLKPGKYMFSAPAISKHRNNNIWEIYSNLAKLENGTYYLSFLQGGAHAGSIKFKTNNSGGITIIDSRHLDFGYSQRDARGCGQLTGDGQAKGIMTTLYTSLVIFNASISTSEWFLRPATQKEIDKNLKEGLSGVAGSLLNKGLWINKDNIIDCLGSGGKGYSYNDVPKIKKMIQSGQIEYRDGEFIIHREMKSLKEEPVKPDISPRFHRIYILPVGIIYVLLIGFLFYKGFTIYRRRMNE